MPKVHVIFSPKHASISIFRRRVFLLNLFIEKDRWGQRENGATVICLTVIKASHKLLIISAVKWGMSSVLLCAFLIYKFTLNGGVLCMDGWRPFVKLIGAWKRFVKLNELDVG